MSRTSLTVALLAAVVFLCCDHPAPMPAAAPADVRPLPAAAPAASSDAFELPDASRSPRSPATCLRCEMPSAAGALGSPALDETSGIVASSTSDDVFFVHNDSGDAARFFAIDARGSLLATFVYSSDAVLDCEDIARGPCASGGSCLFIGDIGDNFALRREIVVYRVVEPSVIADATVSSDALPFVYPDGRHDAETLLVDPRSGAIVIVTKSSGRRSGIYEAPLPLTPGVRSTLRKVGEISAPTGSPQFTGGDVDARRTGILLRTYSNAFYVSLASNESIADALHAPLCSVPVASERQGEAIGWTRDGTGFVTVSEGVGAAVDVTRCGR